MKQRVITGLIMAFILIPLVVVPQCLPVLEIVVILLSLGAELELLNMYDKEKKINLPMKIITCFLTIGLMLSIFAFMANQGGFEITKSIVLSFLDGIHATKMVTPVAALIVCFIMLMSSMIFIHDFEVKDAGRLFMSIIYVAVGGASFLTLRFYGVRFVVYLVLITVATDIFALVFGLTIGHKVFHGKHPLAPNISPKKSWEGAIGGSLVALVLGFVLCYFYKWICTWFPLASSGEPIEFFDTIFNYSAFTAPGKVFVCLVITILLSVCGQIGDLIASKLKRAYGIKDYSQIFPGHGGVLDRFDSLFFAAAMFLLFVLFEQNFAAIVGI